MSKKCGIGFSISLLHPKYIFTWLGLGVFFTISLLPTSKRHVIGKKIAGIIYKKNSHRYSIINTNLKMAFPGLDDQLRNKLVHKHLHWYGCGLVDYSVLFFASKRRLLNMLEIQGLEHIDEALEAGKSVIILLAHSVMLEFAPVMLGSKYDVFGSYKTSKNPVLDWMIAKSRCRHVEFVVSREEGLRKLVKSLSPGKVMIFLPDEDLGTDNAVFAPFFNKSKATLTTTSRIAKMAKAVALPTFTYYDNEKNKYTVKIGLPLADYPSTDAVKDAVNMNQGLEQLIEENLVQYMWSMKWYKTRPEGEQDVY
jgi:lauroyl/myristoyl acyltransferase